LFDWREILPLRAGANQLAVERGPVGFIFKLQAHIECDHFIVVKDK
jgi:hypothetical protein